MIKLEELPTSSEMFGCQENVPPLSCDKCGFSSHVLASLIRHKKAGCDNKVDKLNFLLDAYKCRKCKFVSCSRIITRNHETRCSLSGAPGCFSRTSLWICSHCEFSISYKNHNLDIMFECGVQSCYFTHTRIEELKQHAILVHLPDECLQFLFANDVKSKSMQFLCEHCGQEFYSRAKLHEHTLDCGYKTVLQWFECQECPYKAKSRTHLHSHKLNKHTPNEKIKWFECEECAFKSKTRVQLKQHKLSKHTPIENIKWFECEECPYKGKTKDHLTQHKITKHTPSESVKWFECQECPYKGKTNSGLNKHKITKHTPSEEIKWFECQECSYKCKTKGGLNKHKRNKHTPTDDIKWLLCQNCGYQSKYKISLDKHIMNKHS